MFENHDDESCAFEERSDHDGFDLTAPEYDDIFALHKRFHALTKAYMRARELMEPRIKESGRDPDIARRVAETRMLGNMRLIQLFDELTNRMKGSPRREVIAEMAKVLQTADPLVLTDGLMVTAKHYIDLVDQVDVGIAPLTQALGDADAAFTLFKPLYAEALRVSQRAQVELAQMALRSLVRIMHGVPEWDPETGVEKPSEEDISMPSFDAEVYELLRENGVWVDDAAPAATPPAAKEDETVLLDRLLSGLNLNF